MKIDIEKIISSTDLNDSIIALDNYICERCQWGQNLRNLNKEQKIFYFNQELECEVNNGGFAQYFLNSSGNYAHDTVKSLESIGANHTANILQLAINEFPDKTVPSNREIRQKVLMDMPQKANEIWNNLDENFFQYKDDLNSLNMDFVKRNKSSFSTDPYNVFIQKLLRFFH